MPVPCPPTNPCSSSPHTAHRHPVLPTPRGSEAHWWASGHLKLPAVHTQAGSERASGGIFLAMPISSRWHRSLAVGHSQLEAKELSKGKESKLSPEGVARNRQLRQAPGSS